MEVSKIIVVPILFIKYTGGPSGEAKICSASWERVDLVTIYTHGEKHEHYKNVYIIINYPTKDSVSSI